MPARRTTTRGRAGTGASERPVHADSGAGAVLEPCGADSGPESGVQGVWHMWFQADPYLPPFMRGRTKTGKVRRQPVRYPPNINERRAMHWTVERKAVARWRTYAVNEAKRHAMRPLERVRISAQVHRPRLGVADGSGDSERLKPLVDGLVDAGVIANDTRRFVEYGPVTEMRSGYRGDGILLIVEALEPVAGAGEER